MELAFKELIQSNIDQYGYHVTIVQQGVVPRFAYSIGLNDHFSFELIFPGAIWYMKDHVFQIFDAIFDRLKSDDKILDGEVIIDKLGKFSFIPVDDSWSKLTMLGVFDFYKITDIYAYQIIPDSDHFTYDVPDMSKKWSALSEPVWQWLQAEWTYKVPKDSSVVTNLATLQGAVVTELMRWEEGEWEMFAGPGPNVQEKDTRVIPLATILGIDNTLFPAVSLEIGKGLWRTGRETEWQSWG